MIPVTMIIYQANISDNICYNKYKFVLTNA